MVVDGRAIAKEILASVAKKTANLSFTPKLGVVTCAPGPETRQYLELKCTKADQVGVDVIVLELPHDTTTQDCIATVNRLAEDCHGVLVQLPLPNHIQRELVLDAVPVAKDVDGFAYGRDSRSVLPPVPAAIDAIAQKHNIDFSHKKVAVIGYGRLVGEPAARYAEKMGAEVAVLLEDSKEYVETLRSADIVIAGAGKPHFITKDMVSTGVIIFDAGASEDGGVIVGDVHPEVSQVASIFSPVPGGIGPITVAMLLDNLLKLIRQ